MDLNPVPAEPYCTISMSVSVQHWKWQHIICAPKKMTEENFCKLAFANFETIVSENMLMKNVKMVSVISRPAI